LLKELAKGFLNGGEVGVDVSVVEFNIIENDEFGKVVEELASFIGEGGVVLVTFQNPEGAGAVVASAGEVEGNSADEPAGMEACLFKKESEHGGGGGLAVGAGDDEIARLVEEPTAEEFGEGDKGNAVGEDGFEFGVSAGEGVADDGEVGFRGEILFVVAFVEDDTPIAKEIGHGRIDSLIGSGDLKSQFAEHCGDGTHATSCNSKEVEMFKLGSV